MGHTNISSALRMCKALGEFLKDQKHVIELIGLGLTLDGEFVPVSLRAVPST